MVVAATLMVSTMAIVAPLTVRAGRLWQDVRHRQLAIDALSNELERLTSMTEEQRTQEIGQLAPPAHLQDILPSVILNGELLPGPDGTRLILKLNWDRPGNPEPISLVGWLDSMPAGVDANRDQLESAEESP